MSIRPDLEALLRQTASMLDYPRAEISAGVQQRIVDERIRPRLQLSWAFAATVLFLVFSMTVAMAVSPTVRAVASRLGVPGIDIIFGSEPTTPGKRGLGIGDGLSLGQKMSLDQAQDKASFRISIPSALGEPHEIYFADPPLGGQVSLIYLSGIDLPSVLDSRIGVLVMQFKGTLNDGYYKKIAYGGGTTAEVVQVDSSWGVWIEGEPHVLVYQDRQDRTQRSAGRLAGNTLIWQRNEVTYRLESSLSKERALEIAKTMD